LRTSNKDTLIPNIEDETIWGITETNGNPNSNDFKFVIEAGEVIWN
jgi:hypothetical protein